MQALAAILLRESAVRRGPMTLPRRDLPCWVLLTAPEREATLVRIPSDASAWDVPMPRTTTFHFVPEYFRSCGVDSAELDLWPAEVDSRGSWTEREVLALPRGENRWCVASHIARKVGPGECEIAGVVSGQPYAAHLRDVRGVVLFAPLRAIAPSRLDVEWTRAPGCRIAFTAPLPSPGCLVWTPQDRRSEEPLLAGSLVVPEAAVTAFVPCAAGRTWFVDGCGPDWQFHEPLLVSADGGNTTHVARIRDMAESLVLRLGHGLARQDVQILALRRGPAGEPELVPLQQDPRRDGMRLVPQGDGWLLRTPEPGLELIALIEPCNALVRIPLGGNASLIEAPARRDSFALDPADVAILRADFAGAAVADPWVWLEQRLPGANTEAWHPLLGRRLPWTELVAGRVLLAGARDGHYRLRIRLEDRERIAALR